MPDDFDNYAQRTTIYRKLSSGEQAVGYIDPERVIYRLRWELGTRVGRVSADRRVFRDMRYDERELGSFTEDGRIHSHGLFEGGELGWTDSDGTVVQAGLIFGEDEIGRVDGPELAAAGAVLLLLFLPDEQEDAKRADR